MSGLFENPAKSVKGIAKFLFYACLVLAVILFFMGGAKVLSAADGIEDIGEVMAYTAENYAHGLQHGYDWYIDGYIGKTQCKTAIYVAVASFSSIPLYAFGCLVEDVKVIKKSLQQKKED